MYYQVFYEGTSELQGREAAYKVLLNVEKGAYANISLDEFFKKHKLSDQDRAFATEIVYGTIKYRKRLEWIVGHMVKKGGKLKVGPRLLLLMSFYQLMFMDRVPSSAVTNEAVKLAKRLFHPGLAGLINGVLRNYLRNPHLIKWPDEKKEPLAYLEVYYSHPRWMLERWLGRYDMENTVKLCKFNNEPADLWIRTNTLRITPEELAEKLKGEGCGVEKSLRVKEGLKIKTPVPLYQLNAFQKGLFIVQDETSMLVGHVVDPSPGQKVLDACAAPGGKTTHLAQLMKDQGTIIACDIHEHRLGLIKENAQRLGIKCITTRLQDAAQLSKSQEKYELILIDAPCSGLGVLRRRPDSRWRKELSDIAKLAQLQKEILHNALSLLEPGGRLIYSTCTIEPEENFQVINCIKKEYGDVESFDLLPYWPYTPQGEEEIKELKQGMRQILPFKDEMEGFFIAGLQKLK